MTLYILSIRERNDKNFPKNGSIMKKIEYLIKKYKELSKPVKVSFWFMVCSVMQKGISTLTMPLFTRLLTQAEYGEYSLYCSWLSIFTTLATLELYLGVYPKGMVKYETEEERDQFTFSMQSLASLITIVVFGIYLCLQQLITPIVGLSSTVMVIMFINIFFIPSLHFWSTRERYRYNYVKLVAVTLGMSIANPLLGFLMLNTFEDNGISRIVSIAVIDIVVGVYFYIRNCRKASLTDMTKYWEYGLRYNLPLLPHYISSYILNQSDKAMIGAICGNEQVAIYSVANSIGHVINLITSSVNKAFVPWTFNKLKEEDYKSIRKNSNYLIVLVGIPSFMIIAVAPEILLIFGSNYREATWCVPPIMLGVYCTFLYSLFANIEFYFEKTKFVMVASSLAAALNIGLNAIFIPRVGYIAAAYTTLLCYFVYSVFHALFMVKTCKSEIPGIKIYNLKFIYTFTISLIVCSGLMTLLYRTILLRYLIVVLLGSALLAFIYMIIKKMRR